MNHHLYMVLGMARSGTSAIAKALSTLGVSLGNDLVRPKTSWNPTGFWEDKNILYQIHGKIFQALNFKAYGLMSLSAEEQQSTLILPIRAQAMQLLRDRFASAAHVGFKDPNTVKLLTFWTSICHELNLHPHYVIALRHPLAVAKSYSMRTGVDPEIALLLWLMYLIEAVDHILLNKQQDNTVVVSYELLMAAPLSQLKALACKLHLSIHDKAMAMQQYADAFIDKGLHHFQGEIFNQTDAAILSTVPLSEQVYSLLLSVANGTVCMHTTHFAAQWASVKQTLMHSYPLYTYLDKVLKSNYQLQRAHRAIQKSLLWKLFAPLWRIDLSMREKRKNRQLKDKINKAYG